MPESFRVVFSGDSDSAHNFAMDNDLCGDATMRNLLAIVNDDPGSGWFIIRDDDGNQTGYAVCAWRDRTYSIAKYPLLGG